MPTRTCPSCNNPLKEEAAAQFFPFCSQRCRTIDLGKWLDERYTLPAEGNAEDAMGMALADAGTDGGADDDR